MDSEMKAMLEDYAAAHDFYIKDGQWTDASEYLENDNPDADDETWLEKRTSYIRRVAVLAVWDSNKTDYCALVFGERRSALGEPRVLGHMYFNEGENSDPAGTIARVERMIRDLGHPVFWDD